MRLWSGEESANLPLTIDFEAARRGKKSLLFEGGLELKRLAVLALRSEEAQQDLVRILRVRVSVAQGAGPASKGFPAERPGLPQLP